MGENSNMSTEQRLPWVTGKLPPYNRLVIAYLEGFKRHTDAKWERIGYAFMIRHNDDPKYTIADKWSRSHYEEALKRLDADHLEVTRWIALEARP